MVKRRNPFSETVWVGSRRKERQRKLVVKEEFRVQMKDLPFFTKRGAPKTPRGKATLYKKIDRSIVGTRRTFGRYIEGVFRRR